MPAARAKAGRGELAMGMPARVEPDIFSRIGDTPLVRIRRIAPAGGAEIHAKLEWFNPGGSVKDRAAAEMIREGERTGVLTPEKTLIDATSGNTGIAYAMIGAALGYRVKLALPSNASPERKKILRGYGAELILTDPLKGTDGAIEVIRELHASDPNRYFYPDQYSNDANWRAHYKTTAEEIDREIGDRITHFVAGLGTSGTFMGTSRRLRELVPGIRCVSFIPDSPLHGLEGLKHMPSAMTPAIYDPGEADQLLEIATEEAQEMTRRLAREEGLLAGVSSGAALVAALRVAESAGGGVVVTVFPDGGFKYLSEAFWGE